VSLRPLFLLPLAALTLCSPALAAIVPQHSIGGARLGMTEAQLKARLGAPLKVRQGSNDFGPWRELVYRRVSVFFQGGRKATSLTTKSPLERTKSGVGVGSTLARLRSGLSGEICKREFGIHHCWLGKWEPGRVVTDFRLTNGRVSLIAVSYVFD
jgi:hypothetical protein